MTETRNFHISDILSITDGALVSTRHMEGVYDILGFMTGRQLWTHQLPAAAEEVVEDLRLQHPDLAEVEVPGWVEDEESCNRFLESLYDTYGETRPVRAMS